MEVITAAGILVDMRYSVVYDWIVAHLQRVSMHMFDKLMRNSDVSPRLVIVNAVTAHCAPDWSWNLDSDVREGYDLWFVRQGRGELVSNGKRFRFGSGDCFLLRLWQRQLGRHDPEHPLTVPYIVFDFVDRHGRSVSRSMNHPPLHYRIRDTDFFAGLLDRCVSAHHDGRTDDALEWLRAALRELRHPQNQPWKTNRSSLQARAIEEVCQAILRSPGTRDTVSDLAAQYGWSADHFTRIFRKHKGVTPSEFMIRVRLKEADSLLLFSEHSIARIAYLLGYTDEFAFSHQFKSRRGVSPTHYRASRLTPH